MGVCDRCLFRGEFRDMGASAYTCELERDLISAIDRYDHNHNSYDCPFALFFCDLIDAFDKVLQLPPDCKSKYAYLWSVELREKIPSREFEFSILKK